MLVEGGLIVRALGERKEEKGRREEREERGTCTQFESPVHYYTHMLVLVTWTYLGCDTDIFVTV